MAPLTRRLAGASHFRVAHLDPAGTVEEDTEYDGIGILDDPRRDLAAGPAAVARDHGQVVAWVVGGGALGEWQPGVVPADHPQEQPGAARSGAPGAELAAEGDRVAAVVVGEHFLAEEGESGGPRHGRRQHRDAVVRAAGVILPVRVAGVLGEA